MHIRRGRGAAQSRCNPFASSQCGIATLSRATPWRRSVRTHVIHRALVLSVSVARRVEPEFRRGFASDALQIEDESHAERDRFHSARPKPAAVLGEELLVNGDDLRDVRD